MIMRLVRIALLGGVLAGVIAAAVQSLPDIRRYLEMREM